MRCTAAANTAMCIGATTVARAAAARERPLELRARTAVCVFACTRARAYWSTCWCAAHTWESHDSRGSVVTRVSGPSCLASRCVSVRGSRDLCKPPQAT